jgi:hypothetical protein
MRSISRRWTALVVAVALAGTVAGCVAAAATGAAGAIYATTRGSEALVNGSVEDITTRSRKVMADMDIAPVGEESHTTGDKHELKGSKGDLDITIAMQRSDSLTTKVEVFARKNLAEWDKDFSRSVLERIVAER